ncbi:MAG: hypothetical protein ACKVP5_17780 [Aestuariivirga sp.]
MNVLIDHTRLHRTAKYFMDNGRVETHADAMGLLSGFGLTIVAGPEIATSPSHQVALLTLVNMARRTFLAGVDVCNLPDAPLLVPLAKSATLADAVRELGGSTPNIYHVSWPMACIGSCAPQDCTEVAWQLTWQGWRAGVVPLPRGLRLAEDTSNPLSAALAASVCAAELFAWHAKDHPMSGKRPAGLSLWNPGADWLATDASEPDLAYLPSRLWLIGLGNLGQAFAWLLACLPYADRSQIEFLLQDFDEIAESNDSTSLLSSLQAIGRKKTRVVSEWLEAAGFRTAMEERRFGSWIARGPHDPAVALCGVDNAATRAELGKSGFELIVEAGLGAGTSGFRNFSVHSFPASRRPEEIWSNPPTSPAPDVASMPAYKALYASGLDACGLAQLASRTVGVPFVGLIAAAVALSDPLRRLHGAGGRELVSGSVASLGDIEKVELPFVPYGSGHVRARLIP